MSSFSTIPPFQFRGHMRAANMRGTEASDLDIFGGLPLEVEHSFYFSLSLTAPAFLAEAYAVRNARAKPRQNPTQILAMISAASMPSVVPKAARK
ncbi:MAG TPA: hypothetical protein VKK81_25660 [Candidatus Binatia bacterium]|nr:hypothetical protein [Candidatus Binatia bacterium]